MGAMDNGRTVPLWAWWVAGVVAGIAGLATSYATTMVLTLHDPPVVAVADHIVRLTPGPVAERAIGLLGSLDKPVLIAGLFFLMLVAFVVAGHLARRSVWRPLLVWLPLFGIGLLAVTTQARGGAEDALGVVVGLVTWVVVLSALADPLRRGVRRPELASRERRVFLAVAGMFAVAAVGIAVAGRFTGSGRRHVETSRRLLRIRGVTRRQPPEDATLGLAGIAPWQTPADAFYRIDTALAVPAIEPAEWSLRIHGMVERELRISFADLVNRELTESWVTLGCVSNEVGGSLVGNARWSGVRIADLLEEAGVRPGADCVRQTSHDGWDCATPLSALTDGRDAMLAVAMNGQPLPIEHGFPVRTIVPGLYGYVSATKWVVDLEVTRFDEVETFWTTKGWSELGPVKTASRIDTPRQGADVPAGSVSVGGVAWHQHVGIRAVEVSLDGRDWERAELGFAPSADTWVQWAITFDDVDPGDHVVRVRAITKDGRTQTPVRRDVVPDGATGWHAVEFTANDEA
jgi:DMSO/TMAO reductase YedYZ molybdopterin-dependent catalytic subunit